MGILSCVLQERGCPRVRCTSPPSFCDVGHSDITSCLADKPRHADFKPHVFAVVVARYCQPTGLRPEAQLAFDDRQPKAVCRLNAETSQHRAWDVEAQSKQHECISCGFAIITAYANVTRVIEALCRGVPFGT
eukprot:5615916-Amphidinium_carterae.1